MMSITDEQKERANYVNLPQFLMSHGFDLKRAGKEYIWKDHDSLHIRDNGPGERGQWFRFSENKGGDNIGFLREYMGMSFTEAVEALTGESADRTYTPPTRTYKPEPVRQAVKELSLAEADNSRRVFAYLCKTRGLDYDMLSALVKQGVISQEEKTGNVLFKYFDDKGSVIGAEKVGTSTEHKFKGIATGSAAGQGFEVVRGTGEKAFFFESAIDMLSYLQMYEGELDNCRLVSMMGVKPNIVLETMARHNIKPENVFLCSDNDTAGNDFAERLREEYPDMKRIVTPDRYKDWNDMLRGIPKTEQKRETKEVNGTDMQRYGNEIWNRATDNRDKSIVTVSVHDFPRVQEQLEQSGINYYGYEHNDSVVMAINDKDIGWFGRIVGVPDIEPRKSTVAYMPPDKNIIGNAEYRYIPNKEYVNADRDSVLKMAEIMSQRGIKFSGRIYPTGKGTLTVSKADLDTVHAIRKELIARRNRYDAPVKGQVVGTRAYSRESDTYHFISKLTPEEFNDIRQYLETSVSYHAVVKDNKVAFAVGKEDAPAFHRALENAEREFDLLHSMADIGLSLEQLEALSPVMHRLSVEDIKLDLTGFFDERYDDAQFGEMLALVNDYLAQSPAERYGEHSKLNEMLEAKSSFDRAVELSDFFSQHEFTDEQKAAVTAMFVGDVTRGQIDSIDETFTVEDIQAYDEILHTALQESDVADFLTAHKQAVIDREKASRVPTEERESSIHFGLLGNGITVYDVSRTDPETHDYPTVAHISPYGVAAIYDSTLSEKDIALINAQAESARKEFDERWSKLSVSDKYAELVENADIITSMCLIEEKLSTEEKIEKYMPFVFFNEGERPQPEPEKPAYKIYQLREDEEYHGIRFESMDRLKRDGIQLNHEDYDLVYEGKLDEFKGNESLESLYTKFNIDHPEDFRGHSLSVSDVIVITEDDIDTAFFCDSFGFTEMPEFFREKEVVQEKKAPTVSDLAVGDIIMYDGARREVEKISDKSIMLKDLDAPDYGGVLLSTSDVLSYEGWQQDMERKGFDILYKSRQPAEIETTTEAEMTPLEKAKNLINDFCVDEYSDEADFSDLHNVSLAYTTLTDDELPVQVTADLADYKITYEFDGEVFNTEQYKSIEDMVENGLTGLDFNDLIYVPDEVIERHKKSAEQEEKAEEPVSLMSDASEVQDNTAPENDYPAVTLNYKGDAESLAEIKDKALSLGATVLVDNAEGTISVDTYENHKTEIDSLAYTLGLMSITEFTSAIDKPLFTDADVIENIKRDEHSSDEKPFWELPEEQGMQLNLFGEPEPLVSRKPAKETKTAKDTSKSEFAPGPIVDGVNVFVALAAEIERGTGFVHGKFRVQDFYEKSRTQPGHPTTQELADFLKKEYGTGGHSGEGNISLVDTDSKGMTFLFENGEKFRHSWNNVAAMVEQHLRDNAYLSIREKEMWQEIKAERAAEENPEPYKIEVGDRFRNKATGVISEVVSLSGALPYYTDDCTVKRLSGAFEITENISYDKLLGSLYEYIGKAEPEKELPVTDINDTTAENIEEAPEEPEHTAETDKSVTEKNENFTITDDTLGEGGVKTKYRANVEAIKTLKAIESENRPATAEEKEKLSKYVGWGALAQAFDKNSEKWSAEYKELSELLTPEEYRQARASVNDAFYTSPTVIEGIYEALGKFGFDGGNVLEPAMGVGNFFGCMPADMQKNSKLYGVEIDSLSGRIAKALYPDADIAIKGFEQNSFQNGSFDVAVGNVPFGELGFVDSVHGTAKLHDFFFAESLDKVKDGGILAFVTSAGTLDKHDETTRQMLADKADFIGAVRLPGGKNGAFKDNAGTEVTTDIIFLKKHEGKSVSEMLDVPEWVHIGETADGLPINKYFETHPDMVLGKVIEGNKLYGSGTMVVAEDSFDLKTAIHEAVGKLSAEISHDKCRDVYAKTVQGEQVQIPSNLRNYSFFLSGDQVYFKRNNAACEARYDKSNAQHKRFTAFIGLRDLTRELLEAQELDKSDSVIKDLQAKLNDAYDDFYKKFGLIHSQTNKRYFSEDVSYNLVAGLEKSYDKTELKEKSDIFFKRTIVPPKAVEHIETALEALTLSVAEKARVDFEYMNKLTGMTEDELKHDLSGEIFKVPHTENEYQTASEYLSGDIRKKLHIAEEVAEYDPDFNINVSALKKAMPEPLKAGDIDVKLGASWVDPKYYEQFIYELLQTPAYQRSDSSSSRWNKSAIIGVEYSEHTNSFHVSNKSSDRSVLATQKFGSHKMNAYDIFEHILNLQEPKIYKTIEVPDGMGDTKEKRVVDIDATRIVQRKADDMRKAFKDWIFKDPVRREAIVDRYNELFNSIRPREYDGSNLSFPLMTNEINLHDHQKNAIAHAMFGGNTLFAHSVGAGKTFEMIATAMESKRLGLCTKSLFAVPNHLTEQIGDDFQRLYPSANILVATKKDFQKANRQQLFAKIATGNYDAVIIGHSQLGMIPVSKERQQMTIQSQIDDILQGIEELKEKEDGSRFQIKAMERSRKSLQKQLDKLEKMNQDDTLTFEQLGVDRLFVDEMHEFKNLFTPTKLTNVAGISNSASQKALDLFLKVRYLDEKTGGKGFIGATGTPLSNSVTELHTMMRYLEYDFLKDHGLQHFDNWVSVFGEQKTDWELRPAGNGFKERTRIASFSGLPELMSMFKQVADIRTADTLKLDVPDCEYKVVQVDATPFQQELVQELADRADAVNNGNVDPTIDNMLRITSDGRKLGLDPRLFDPSFEDDPNTKLNQCVENVARIHEATAEDRLTQIIFCDLGVPHKSSAETEVAGEDSDDAKDKKSMAELESLEEECDFCVYDDIRDKLIAKGIPADEIAYIHDAKTEKQKADLFDKVRSGEVRVLLGSTSKMGTGTNVQKKLIAVHDLDIPWRPADLDQRAGRIIRQGNENKNVQIYRYVTKGTFDAYSYQTLENKQKFISQIMTSKTPARKCEDVDQQALTYAEIKALCTGDERIKEKLMLENDVKELRILSAEHRNTVYEMQDKIAAFPDREKHYTSLLDALRADRETLRRLPIDEETKRPVFKITIGETEYTDKKEAAKALETAALSVKVADTPVKIGSFQGFELSVTMNSNMMGGGMSASMKGETTHSTKLIESFYHNLNRIEANLYNIDSKIVGANENLAKLRLDYAEAQKIVSEPFPQQTELENKEERLKTLTEELNQAAIEAKKNAPKREKTCYFERAKLKRDAMRIAQKPKKNKSKDQEKKKPELE